MQGVPRTEQSRVMGAPEKVSGGGYLCWASKDREAAKMRREGKRTFQVRG